MCYVLNITVILTQARPGTVVVISSTLLYGGAIKLQSQYWNTEPDSCRRLREESSTSTPKATPSNIEMAEKTALLKSAEPVQTNS